MKICTIIGARPQFIKAAVVSRAIADHNQTEPLPESINEIIVHTGQHYDSNMSDVFFEELSIPRPNHHLGIGGGSHGQNTGRMIEAIESVLSSERPDWVVVYGDTDSTLAGAIAAVKLHLPIAHVEAGLRSFNRRMPEEINRVLTDHASSLLFTPTITATHNLKREGIIGDSVKEVGDVMYDASLFYGEVAVEKSAIMHALKIQPRQYILATIHRAENTDDQEKMGQILEGFAMSEQEIVWPIHPRTRKRIYDFELSIPKNVKAIEPVGYLDMVVLEKSAKQIVTDSGGIQKEAYFFRVPCVTIRDETEWVETLAHNANVLIAAISKDVATQLRNPNVPTVSNHEVFGDGRAGVKIVNALQLVSNIT